MHVRHLKRAALTLVFVGLLAYVSVPAQASINSMGLGASYNSGKTTVTFRVYSAAATRITLYVYAEAYGAQEVASYPMTSSSGVWSTTVSVSTLQSVGITGPIYYGYRGARPELAIRRKLVEGVVSRLQLRRGFKRQPLQSQ